MPVGTSRKLKAVEVRLKKSVLIGALYFKTPTSVVLLNNIYSEADLGRLRQKRTHHLTPEADVIIVPRSDVISIAVIKAK